MHEHISVRQAQKVEQALKDIRAIRASLDRMEKQLGRATMLTDAAMRNLDGVLESAADEESD